MSKFYNDLDDVFFSACSEGNLKKVKKLLTESFSSVAKKANIHACDDYGFRVACENNQIEIVKYLLTSKDLTEHTKIDCFHEAGLRIACEKGHLELLKYLLTDESLIKNSNVHAVNDDPFKLSCIKNKIDIVNYLIFDFNITKTKEIENFLKENQPLYSYAQNAFNSRQEMLEMQDIKANSSSQKEKKLNKL